MYPYKPDKVYHIGAWTVKIFEQEGKALLHKGKNINYVIDREVDYMNKLPKYLVKFLWDIGFLQEWRDQKVLEVALRLKSLRERYEKSPNRKKVI